MPVCKRGFETGDFSEFQANYKDMGTKFVRSGGALCGQYYAEFTITNNDGAYAVCREQTTSLMWRTRMLVMIKSLSGLSGTDRLCLMRGAIGANLIYEAGVRMWGGFFRWYLMIRNGVAYVSDTGGSPALNEIYCMQVSWYNSVGGYGTLYVNGVAVISITGQDTTQYLGTINADYGPIATFGQCAAQVYIDDVLSATTGLAEGLPALYCTCNSGIAPNTTNWVPTPITPTPSYEGEYCPLCPNSANKLDANNSCPEHGVITASDFTDYGMCSICGGEKDRFGQCKYVTTHCEALGCEDCD